MELRSYNVERIYNECVVCSIGEDLGVRKSLLEDSRDDIISMLKQISTVDGKAVFKMCNLRKDGESWTPYLQIVAMLIRLGRMLNAVEYYGTLKEETIITIKV